MPCLKRIVFCVLSYIVALGVIVSPAFSSSLYQEEAAKYASFARACEARGDFLRAADYWLKVIEEAGPEDPWLFRARQRLETIGEVIPSVRNRLLQQESVRMSGEALQLKHPADSPQSFIARAKEFSKNKDYTNSLKTLLEAKQSDPGNEELDKLIQLEMAKLFH